MKCHQQKWTRLSFSESHQQKWTRMRISQIWLRHDQDLCVSSIWPGDGVLGTLVTNWAQPRSFSSRLSSTSQRCSELWDRQQKSLKFVQNQVWETILFARIMCGNVELLQPKFLSCGATSIYSLLCYSVPLLSHFSRPLIGRKYHRH